ncbi:hypothetical protein ACFYUY_39525 [Kitasatospora sp. NPDC004745]|uniref:hypothetical protein n=1 Tax=Kitasatospora sp. NPDC004745 TaxID=3364019 RepID=UPI00368F8D64
MRFVMLLLSVAQVVIAVAASDTKKQTGAYPKWYCPALLASCSGLLVALAVEQSH